MSKADYLKARIGYPKFWLVIFIAASLLLASSLVSNFFRYAAVLAEIAS